MPQDQLAVPRPRFRSSRLSQAQSSNPDPELEHRVVMSQDLGVREGVEAALSNQGGPAACLHYCRPMTSASLSLPNLS